jgi:hypothetical protein
MAMALTVSPVVPRGFQGNVVVGTIVASGNYVNPNGDTPSPLLSAIPGARLAKNPKEVIIQGIAGYIYRWVAATGKILVFFADNNNAADGPLIEIPNGAYPAGVTGDTITFTAIYQ